MTALRLRLVGFHVDAVHGIYKVGGVPGRMPDRMRFLHPDVAPFFSTIAPWAVCSDMFRSPESSLAAVQGGRGAKAPGYSAHNYGLAIDLDLGASRKGLAARIGRAAVSKAELDEAMEAAGWYCHRRDHLNAFEAWHYNFLGINTVIGPKFKSTAGWIEAKIVKLYGGQLRPDDLACQEALKRLRLYSGAIDGDIGPISRAAIGAFQRTWSLEATGKLDDKTRRTLAYVACERVIEPEAVT